MPKFESIFYKPLQSFFSTTYSSIMTCLFCSYLYLFPWETLGASQLPLSSFFFYLFFSSLSTRMSYVRYSYMRCTCHSCLSYGVFRNSLVLFPHFFSPVWLADSLVLNEEVVAHTNSEQSANIVVWSVYPGCYYYYQNEARRKHQAHSSEFFSCWSLMLKGLLRTDHETWWKKKMCGVNKSLPVSPPGQSYLLYKILIDYWSSYWVLP